MKIPFLVEYSTDYDTDVGGAAIMYAECSEDVETDCFNFCYKNMLDELNELDFDGTDVVFDVKLDIREFNSFEDGDIRGYDVIE